MAPAVSSDWNASSVVWRGRAGSFVLQHTGTFNGSDVTGTCFVAPQSGTGELVSLRGEGEISLSGHAELYPLKFSYHFE